MNVRSLAGRFYKNASKRESYEIMDADSRMIFKISTLLLEKYSSRAAMPVMGLDEVYLDHTRGALKVTVGWDNWSGCFVQANNPDSDDFVLEFGAVLDSMLIDLITPLKGQLYDDNPARLCYEIYYANDGLLAKLIPIVVDEFALQHRLDGHLLKTGQVIQSGWERWRGCYFQAMEGDLLHAIADFLNRVMLDEL